MSTNTLKSFGDTIERTSGVGAILNNQRLVNNQKQPDVLPTVPVFACPAGFKQDAAVFATSAVVRLWNGDNLHSFAGQAR